MKARRSIAATLAVGLLATPVRAAPIEVQPGADGRAPVIIVRPQEPDEDQSGALEPTDEEPPGADLDPPGADFDPQEPAAEEPVDALPSAVEDADGAQDPAEPARMTTSAPPETAEEPARPKPPPPSALETGVPGGYYEPVDLQRRDEPRDGETLVTTGAVLFSIGALNTVIGGAQVFIALPPRCTEIYTGASSETCEGLVIFGAVGLATGALMTLTGAGILGAGLIQRARHRAWRRERGLAFGPSWIRGGGGLRVQLRF